MSTDRLGELADEDNPDSGTGGDEDNTNNDRSQKTAEIADHMARYEPIKKGLDLIKRNVAEIEKLKAKNKTTANEKARNEIMNEMERLMNSTSGEAGRIKKALEQIKAENEAFGKDKKNQASAKKQMRDNLYQTHLRRFHTVMNDYNSAIQVFKSELQKRSKREIKIVNPELDEQQVDNIIESGKAGSVIKDALMNTDHLQDVVRVIEERHMDIIKLEQQVLEVYELFRDLATLVDLQQESLDVIENRIIHARDYAEAGEVELVDAEDYQRKARNRRCCLFMIALGVLAAILVPVIWTKLKSS